MKGWRTIAFNVAALALTVLALPEVQALIPPDWWPFVLATVAVGNILLRTVTTTPMGKKD